MARHAIRLAERWTGRAVMAIEHPPRDSRPRYGHGRPPHRALCEILARDEAAYTRNLELIAGYGDDLSRIPATTATEAAPTWLTRWLLGLDIAALYSFVRAKRPRTYLEVGSGMSTLMARRAVDDEAGPTSITSIDPHPRAEVEPACDRAVRTPLETADLTLFSDLVAGDMVFMDGSHHVFTNSDATVFFLDVLPAIPAGVLVGVHDILLPDDYLPEWAEHHWSEQYLMAAYLLGGGEGIQLELACNYVTEHSDLHHILDPLWESLNAPELDRRGFTLWFSTTGT